MKNTMKKSKTTCDMIQARITPEMRAKIAADMKRLGVKNESEYVRMMIQGEVSGNSDMLEIKDLLDTVIEKIESLTSNMVEISIRLKDLEFEIRIMKGEVENLNCNPEKEIRFLKANR